MSVSSLSKDKSIKLFKRPVNIDDLRSVWIRFVAEKSLSALQDVIGSVMMPLNIGENQGKFSLSIFHLVCWVKTVNSASLIAVSYKSHGAFNSSFMPKLADPGKKEAEARMIP